MLWCSSCHGPHAKIDCPKFKEIREVPLETPSHNGIWQGKIPVRVLAPGESGELDVDAIAKQKADRGRARQSAFSRALSVACSECGKAFKKPSHWDRRRPQCSDKCRKLASKRKRAEKKAQKAEVPQ